MPASKGIQEQVAVRRAKVIKMRSIGVPTSVIAGQLGVSEEVVRQDAHVVLSARRDELAQDCDLLVAAQVEELEHVRQAAWRNATRRHYQVTPSGAVARDPETGEPLIDTAPVDRALGLVIRAQERMAKLLGLDAALKIHADVEHRVITIDELDAAIADLEGQLARKRGRSPE